MAVKKSTNDGNDPEKNALKYMPHVPKDFEYELTNLNSVVSWSKNLDAFPQFSAENIEKHANIVTAGVLSKSTVVKKHFSRGEQLLEEQYVDIVGQFSPSSQMISFVSEVSVGLVLEIRTE